MPLTHQPQSQVRLTHPEWSKNAVIYQINTRQFTKEGTFHAAEAHLPRLKEMGMDIIWLMPIHEIGQVNRKGTLGSPYAVKDYYSVNPEFGTFADLKHFVDAAHALDMYVILDWVPNHTAWDSVLAQTHPEWFAKNWKGDFTPTPWWDWSDIIDLDYSQQAVREYMSAAMKFWVVEAGVDGFRCDVAGFVPLDFWNKVRKELDSVKPVFMLAEWENRDLHAEAFDMTYGWSWYETVSQIVQGKGGVNLLHTYYSWNEKAYPHDVMRMLFVTNHDKNAWDGTMHEVFGDAVKTAIALSVISEGMPLVFNGQEAGETKRLPFFEKDSIDWVEHPIGELYKKLIALKKRNTALWNAKWGARMIHVPNNVPLQVFSFVRQNEKGKVFAVFNFSPQPHVVTFEDSLYHGQYTEYMSGSAATLSETSKVELEAWGYRVFVK